MLFSIGSLIVIVVAVDNVGNIGTQTTHYQINIDRTPPTITINEPIENNNYSNVLLAVVDTPEALP